MDIMTQDLIDNIGNGLSRLGEPLLFAVGDREETPEKRFLDLGFSSVEVWIGEHFQNDHFLGKTSLRTASFPGQIMFVVLKV